MPTPNEAAIRDVLAKVIDPATGKDAITAGLISGLVLRGGRVGFLVAAAAENMAAREVLAERCRTAVAALPGVTSVSVVLSGDVSPGITTPKARPAMWSSEPVPGVKRIVAVGSGKGGVGKSTVAVLLAHAFHAEGMRVGLLDADIHGPSIPRMLGISAKPEVRDGKLIPVVGHGIACLSTGLLLPEDEAAVLRGPMVGKTLQQFLRGADWGGLDLLLIDLPPGTGDVQLSLAQNVPLGANGGGAILVTTPQAVALADARKAASMFRKTGVPILGVIENMSWLEQADGHRHALFGEGGGAALAGETGVPLLAQLPLDPAIGQALDQGEAIIVKQIAPISSFLLKIWRG